MNKQREYLLAYHPANFEEAHIVNKYLTQGGYKIKHFKSSLNAIGSPVSQSIRAANLPTIILVSDNFLKCENCLLDLFETYKIHKAKQEFVAIVCDGQEEIKGDFEKVPTSFSKLSGVIKYLNYWQDKYLKARSKKRTIPEEEAQSFSDYLKVIRSISTEVGDFLKDLNKNGTLDFDDLANNNFEGFYQKVNDPQGFENYFQNLANEAAEELVKPMPEKEQVAEKFVSKAMMPELKSPDEVIQEIEHEELVISSVPPTGTPSPLSDINILFGEEDPKSQNDKTEMNEVLEIINKAGTFLKKGNQADGMKVLKRGIEIHPKSTALRYEYGSSLARYTREYNLAKFHLKENLNLDPNHTKTLFLLGRMAELDGDVQTAINFYEGVVDSEPDFPEVNFRLAMLYLIHKPEKRERAVQLLEKEAAINSKNTEAKYRLGALLNENDEAQDRALALFEQVVKSEPKHQFVNYDIALIYFRKNEMEKAKLYYNRATFVNPELKTKENDLAFGLRKVVKTVKLNPTTPEKKTIKKKVVKKAAPQKIALITGGTSGIGKATARIFAENGYKIIITGRRAERLEKLQKEWQKEFDIDCHTLNFDVRDKEAVAKAINDLPKEWQQIDLLINNAGLAKGLAPIHEGDYEHWETMIDTNIKGILYMTRLVAPLMVARKSGHIINVCSTAGKEVYPNGNVYCASKHAVDALTKGMRIDLHKHNIRVSQVAPAHVEETEFAEVRFDGNKKKAKIYEDFNPLTSKDVAETIFFIATRPAHVNIQDVVLMGTQQANSTTIDRSGRKYDK